MAILAARVKQNQFSLSFMLLLMLAIFLLIMNIAFFAAINKQEPRIKLLELKVDAQTRQIDSIIEAIHENIEAYQAIFYKFQESTFDTFTMFDNEINIINDKLKKIDKQSNKK